MICSIEFNYAMLIIPFIITMGAISNYVHSYKISKSINNMNASIERCVSNLYEQYKKDFYEPVDESTVDERTVDERTVDERTVDNDSVKDEEKLKAD